MTDHIEPTKNFGVISALIMDDNAFDRRRLQRIAKSTDLEFFIREAATPEDFGLALDNDKFDIIFVDLNLSADVDGFSLAPIARNHSVNSEASLIMIAGEDQAEVALQALRVGFADYIDKGSLSPAALERATVNAIQKRRLSQAANHANAETRSVEAVLRSFANVCQREMRPMLTRMVRQVRQMRADLEAAQISSENITNVEKTCARMGEFLQDLGDLANEGQLETAALDPVSQSPAPLIKGELNTLPDQEVKVIPQRVRKASLFGGSART